jgi:hypothetical protein
LITLPPLTVKSNVKEVRAATHASRNQMLAAIQSCDYVATAIRLLYRVSKVIHSECYGFDDDNSQIGPPNGKQIEGNAGSSSSNTPPQGSGALSTPKHNDKVDPLGAQTHDKNSGTGSTSQADHGAALQTAVVRSVKDSLRAEKTMKGAFRTLLTLPAGGWLDIVINDTHLQVYADESAQYGVTSMPNTHHFYVRDRESHKLYWYEQFAGILTPSHLYVEFCALSNGDVCVGVWETRCSRPFHALLVYRTAKERCELFTAHDYRKIFPGVHFDPDRLFDMEHVVK